MTNKFSLLLFSLIFLHIAFSQNSNAQQLPQAQLLSSGDIRPALSRPRFAGAAANDAENAIYQSADNYRLEQQVFGLINQQRVQLGLASLEWNDDIAKMARAHSESMANFKFFSHSDLNGWLVNDRADASGIRHWRAIGENIAYNRGYENPAAFAVERWMQSPSHRENLLNNRWKQSGIGIAVTNDGTYYFTEVFLLKK